MRREYNLYLEDILTSINKIKNYAGDTSSRDSLSNFG